MNVSNNLSGPAFSAKIIYASLAFSQLLFFYLYEKFLYIQPAFESEPIFLTEITAIVIIAGLLGHFVYKKGLKQSNDSIRLIYFILAWSAAELIAIVGMATSFLEIQKSMAYLFMGAGLVLLLTRPPRFSKST